jgi:hypothetical protein
VLSHHTKRECKLNNGEEKRSSTQIDWVPQYVLSHHTKRECKLNNREEKRRSTQIDWVPQYALLLPSLVSHTASCKHVATWDDNHNYGKTTCQQNTRTHLTFCNMFAFNNAGWLNIIIFTSRNYKQRPYPGGRSNYGIFERATRLKTI